MATGYNIEIGYNSGNSDKKELWDALANSVQIWRINAAVLEKEAKDYGAPDKLGDERLTEYCEVYSREWGDGGPLSVHNDKMYILIMASGGDPSRTMKEHVARAFCRIIVHDMHRKGIEVNLTVA